MRRFAEAFDVEVEGMEALELNPETMDTVIQTRGAQLLKDSPELLMPSIRARAGLEPDKDVAAARNLQATMQFEALTDITNDPELRSEFVSRALGREPITLTIPGFGGQPDQSVSFDSPTAANIYAQFLLARERFSLELDLQNTQAAEGLFEEIQSAVPTAGFSVSSNAL
jgi:hypothetical protein